MLTCFRIVSPGLCAGLLGLSMLRAADSAEIHTPARLQNIAGTGVAGEGGEGGPALQAQLKEPFGLVRGPDGALWFCDFSGHQVRRLAPDGTLTTVVGTGRPGYSSEPGSARQAALNHPHEVRFGSDGNLYIADTSNHAIRRFEVKTGMLTTIAGTGNAGYEGDGGPAIKASFKLPISIQFSPAGDLYVADIGNHVIRRIEGKTGTISTFAGTGKAGTTPESSPVTGTPLNGPRSLDFDASGDLWLVTREGNQVLRFDLAKGIILRVAGTGKQGFTGDGGPAREATLSGPKGIAVAPDGSVYLVDTENHAVRRIDPAKGSIERVVGTGELGDGPEGDPLLARLARPHGVYVEGDGAVLISDSENHRIRRLGRH